MGGDFTSVSRIVSLIGGEFIKQDVSDALLGEGVADLLCEVAADVVRSDASADGGETEGVCELCSGEEAGSAHVHLPIVL